MGNLTVDVKEIDKLINEKMPLADNPYSATAIPSLWFINYCFVSDLISLI